jgi:hypothetical protein
MSCSRCFSREKSLRSTQGRNVLSTTVDETPAASGVKGA